MHIIDILLPVAKILPNRAVYDRVQRALTEKFGGVTTYSRAPAEGLWNSGDAVERDDIVVLEVMAENLERMWWTDFRRSLEKSLEEKEIVITCHAAERL